MLRVECSCCGSSENSGQLSHHMISFTSSDSRTSLGKAILFKVDVVIAVFSFLLAVESGCLEVSVFKPFVCILVSRRAINVLCFLLNIFSLFPRPITMWCCVIEWLPSIPSLSLSMYIFVISAYFSNIDLISRMLWFRTRCRSLSTRLFSKSFSIYLCHYLYTKEWSNQIKWRTLVISGFFPRGSFKVNRTI